MDSLRTLEAGYAGRDLRDWLAVADSIGQLERIEGAGWDLEIGTVTEMIALRSRNPRCLLFDNIPGYPAGYRVATNSFTSKELSARLLDIPMSQTIGEMAQAWRVKSRDMRLLPPREVVDGPVFEH